MTTSLEVPDQFSAENKIVVLDYTGTQTNLKQYSFNSLKPEIIFLRNLNISNQDIFKTFHEKLMSKIMDGRYIMNNKDALHLDKMIGLACIAMNESEKNNKWLRARNIVLENKCTDYDQVVKECNRLKSEMDKITKNLCLALGRKINDRENVMHLINVCSALFARENENNYILMENNKLNYALMDIRVKTINNYDEILNNIHKSQEEQCIKNLKISQLMEDICLMKQENEKKDNIIQCLREQLSEYSQGALDNNVNCVFDDSKINDELYEGKLLIAEEINQFEGSNRIEADNYKLSNLIKILIKSILDKEENLETIDKYLTKSTQEQNQQLIKEIDDHKKWQNHLENENERLISEIEDYKRVQQNITSINYKFDDLKEDYSKMQCMYDGLSKENTHLKALIDEYQYQLTEKKKKCVDGDHLIKTLESNLIEQSNKFEHVNSMYIREKEKCQRIENYTHQMVEELSIQIHEKNSKIISIQEDCSTLKHHIEFAEIETDNLKRCNINLECLLNEKNKSIKELSTKLNEKQHLATQFNSLLHVLSQLEQEMDIMLNDLYTCKKKLLNYESVLNSMKSDVEYQFKTRNNWLAKLKNMDDKKLLENVIKEKETILLEHQKQVDFLKNEYNLKIKHMTGMDV